MSFLWPPMLLGLLLAPVLAVVYVVSERRRSTRNVVSNPLISPATENGSPRRHLSFVFYFVAFTLLLLGFARPELSIGFPRTEGTVVIAIDSSTSMVANDVLPTRLHVARSAATTFVEQRPTNMTIGLVSFTNGAVVTQAPTKSETDLVAAIARMRPEGPTSIGQGLLTGLGAITGDPIAIDTPDGAVDIAAINIGFHGASALLVFSDGENTTDFDPIEIAKLAANAGIKIFTVGVGTSGGAAIEIDGFLIATQLDSGDLREMAEITGGQYFETASGDDLASVYDAIGTELRVDAERTEVTAFAAGLGALLLIIGAAVALRQTGRLA